MIRSVKSRKIKQKKLKFIEKFIASLFLNDRLEKSS